MRPSDNLALSLFACALLGAFLLAPGCMEQTPSQPAGASPCEPGDLLFVTEEIYPYSFMENDGTLNGTSVAVVQEMVRRSGCGARLELHPWNASYGIALATPGAAVFPTARTPEREDRFLWAGPIGTFEYVLYARNDSGIRLESLEAARAAGTIAVVEDDARHEFLEENHFTNIRTYPTDEECMEALRNGSVALWLGSSAESPGISDRSGIADGTIIPVYSLMDIDLYLAFHKQTSPETVARFQQALDAMKADGTYARLTGLGEGKRKAASPVPTGRTVPVGTALSSLSGLTGSRLQGVASALEAFALTSDAGSGDWDRVRPVLLRLEEDYPGARFWYARADGSYYTTVDNLTSANLRDRSYFPVVLSGKTTVGTVVVSKTTGRYTAIVAAPVLSGGEVSHVLGTSVSCDSLREYLKGNVPLPDGYYFFILAQDGSTVLDSLTGRTFSIAGDTGARDRILSTDEGECAYNYEGASHRAVFRTEPVTGWKVAIAWME